MDSKYARITPGAFQAMLRYFYYSDTNIGMLHATELVDFVKDFHLDRLYKGTYSVGPPYNQLLIVL